MRARPILFVCGGLTNLGDLALLRQNLAIVHAKGRTNYVRVWGTLPGEIVTQVKELNGVPVDGRRLIDLLKVAARCDVVIGGGQLLRDNASVRGLVYLLTAVTVARICGGQVTTCGLGISTLNRRWLRTIWRLILGSSDKIAVRDRRSGKNAKALLPRQRVYQTADMAFHPGPLGQELKPHRDDLNRANGALLIAPCIESSEDRTIDGPAFQTLLDVIYERPRRRRTVVACHDPRPEIDGGAADTLIGRYHFADVYKDDSMSLASLCANYRTAWFVITNRFHSVIFALHASCPVLVIDDGTGKMVELCDTFSVPSIRVDGSQGRREISDAVDAALSFDHARRASKLAEMAQLAARNLRAAVWLADNQEDFT